jgi:hypothetical protein
MNRGAGETLQPGLLVKDRLGARKRITRVQDDTVYWEYVNQPSAGAPRANSTPTKILPTAILCCRSSTVPREGQLRSALFE